MKALAAATTLLSGAEAYNAVKAGQGTTINGTPDQIQINLLAAKNTDAQHSTNRSASGSIGISIGTGGFGVTASASMGRGHADGSDVAWTNTHVEAGKQLTLQSGADTTLSGATAKGNQVVAQVGGNLNIESRQDTSVYDSRQQRSGPVCLDRNLSFLSGALRM